MVEFFQAVAIAAVVIFLNRKINEIEESDENGDINKARRERRN